MKNVIIMAGGTGGHVMPALSVAEQLMAHGVSVHWLGTAQGLEARLVPQHNIPLHIVNVRGVRGKKWLVRLLAPWMVLRALWSALKIIHRLKPMAVLGMGGFVAGPGGIAAWLLRTPLIIHEQNAVAGFTNRVLARFAKQVMQAYPHTFAAKVRALTIGNPVRAQIAALPTPEQRDAERQGCLKLLVIGGSQGALFLNQLLVDSLAQMDPAERPEVWHQVGAAHLATTQAAYQAQHLTARLEAFIDGMDNAYGWADLVLCRAGALTIAELTAAGVASILVPFPYAVDDHQTRNAQFLADAGAALLVQQRDLDAQRLLAMLQKFLHNRADLLTMAQAARQLATPDAAQAVAEQCLRFDTITRTQSDETAV